jgi:hypothetical protein
MATIMRRLCLVHQLFTTKTDQEPRHRRGSPTRSARTSRQLCVRRRPPGRMPGRTRAISGARSEGLAPGRSGSRLRSAAFPAWSCRTARAWTVRCSTPSSTAGSGTSPSTLAVACLQLRVSAGLHVTVAGSTAPGCPSPVMPRIATPALSGRGDVRPGSAVARRSGHHVPAERQYNVACHVVLSVFKSSKRNADPGGASTCRRQTLT